MELLRKVISVGTSRAVTIPSQVFESYKNKGKTFTTVRMILNDEITIVPILEDIVDG